MIASRLSIGRLAVLLMMLVFGHLGCAPDEICTTGNDTLVKIKFLVRQYPGTDSARILTDTLIFNSVGAVGTDSIFISGDTLTALAIPLNTGTNSTTFLFDSNQGVDTLQLNYQRFQTLVSVDCGPEQVIDSLKLGIFSFDSAVISGTLLHKEVVSNVEIYR